MVPDGWTEVRAGEVVFAVPPDFEPLPGSPVDSAAGGFEGEGVLVTYDVGRFGPDLRELENSSRSLEVGDRRIAGRSGVEASFVPVDEPFGFARLVQVDVRGSTTATIRVACAKENDCAVADQIFDSIDIR